MLQIQCLHKTRQGISRIYTQKSGDILQNMNFSRCYRNRSKIIYAFDPNIYKIKLSRDKLKKLLNMIHTVNTEMDRVEIKDNGEDLKVNDAHRDFGSNSAGGNRTFGVRTGILKNISEGILNQRSELIQMSEGIASVRERLGLHYAGLISAIVSQEQQVKTYGKCCEQLGKALQEISQKYEETEKKIAGSKV